MPRSKSKSEANPRDASSSTCEAPSPASGSMSLIPHIATLDLEDDEALQSQEFPLSSARNEPCIKPTLKPFICVPSPSLESPPKKGKKNRSRRSLKPDARLLQDQGNILNNSQVVADIGKPKRGKIQVQKSSRVLRPRGCQLKVSVEPEKERGNTSALRLTQGNQNHETPYWAVSWDKWANVRGTIRRAKS